MSVNIEVNRKLYPLLTKKKRFKIIIGGRGSGKSNGIADVALIKCMQGKKIACFREFQNSIRDSVYSLLCAEIDRLCLDGFTITRDEIHHSSGGLFIFKGLERNKESIKSMFGFDIAWIEEAQTISDESLKLLTPTIRSDNSELWFCGNPRSSEDAFSQRFIERKMNDDEDHLHLRIVMNYQDNKWFPKELEMERLDDFERLPRALYDHVWLGAYNDSVENSIILAEWFDSAVMAHDKLGWKPEGAIVTAHDPADNGDARATVTRHGNVILDVNEETTLDINESCDKAMNIAIDKRSDFFVYDADGCGLGLRRQVSDFFEDSHCKYIAFRGGSSCENAEMVHEMTNGRAILVKDAYKNLRAQKYFEVAARFQKTYQAIEKGSYIDPNEMISIHSDCSNLAKLKAELCRIPQVYNTGGQFQVMSKKDMMSRLKIKSPNISDCVMMSYIQVRKPRTYTGSLSPKLGIC